MMPPQTQKWVRAAWVITLLISITILILAIPGYQNFTWVSALLSLFAALLSLGLGILVYWRRPAEPMAVFFSFYLLLYSVYMCGPIEAANAYWLPEQPDLSLILQSLFIPIPNVILLLIFPNGKFAPRWTRYLVGLVVLFTLGTLFVGGQEILRPTNPLTILLLGLIYGILLLSIGIQVYRYRNLYTYRERQQTKWAVLGILAWFIAMGISSIPFYYLLYLPPDTPNPWWAEIMSAGWWLTISLIPVSFTIAILHSRLWAIDLIIRRTLLYSLVTGFLLLVYFGMVTLLQTLFSTFTGQQSPLAIVISTLAIAALFNPLRQRLQNFIDQRFFRKRYNAEQALAKFSAIARSEVDLGRLSKALIQITTETMQPEVVILRLSEFSDYPASTPE